VPSREEPERLVLTAALVVALCTFAGGLVATLASAWVEGAAVTSSRVSYGLAISGLAGLLAGGVAAFLVIRPVARMASTLDAARRMAEGDLAVRAPETIGIAGMLGGLLNAVGGSGSRLLLSVRREQGRQNEQVSVLRSSSARTRERATAALSRIDAAESAVASFDGAIRSIAESVETLSAGSEETAAAVAEVDGSLSQVLARSEGLHRASEEGTRAAASLVEGAAVLGSTLTDLAHRAEELTGASRGNEQAVGSVAASAGEASAHASRVATSDVTLVVMHDRDFRAMEEEIPAIAKRVDAIMEERRARSTGQGIET